MLLPKHHAEAGRVSLYEGYFHCTGFAGTSLGVEAGNGAEEEASGACWETQRHIRKGDQSFPTTRGQTQSQRASKLGRLYGARQQTPSFWRLVLASARELKSHGRTSCCRQPGQSGGGATYAAVLAGPIAPSQPSGPNKPTAMDSDPSEHGVSMETTNRHISSDKSRRLSGRPDGTSANAQVAKACPPARKRPKKTTNFISGVSDTRSCILPWRSDGPTKGRKVDGRPINRRWVRSRGQYAAVP